MSDVYDPDPENGPAAQRERMAEREFLSGLPSKRARDAYYANVVEMKRRAQTAAPKVGLVGTGQVDPEMLKAMA
jgi:hypothetical protein